MKQNRKLEKHIFRAPDLRVEEREKKPVLTGTSTVYDEEVELFPGLNEVIRPGAATKTLSEKPDVRALQNHNVDLLFGRTTNDTLALKEDKKGVHTENDVAPIADLEDTRKLVALIEGRYISQMSFAFWVMKVRWTISEDPEENDLREILEFSLDNGDVSYVTYPAYQTTNVDVNWRWMDVLNDRRSLSEDRPLHVRTRRWLADRGYDPTAPFREPDAHHSNEPEPKGHHSAEPDAHHSEARAKETAHTRRVLREQIAVSRGIIKGRLER